MKFMIEGLDCAHCATKIETKLNKDQRVNSASLNFVTKTVQVEFTKNVNQDDYLDIVSTTVKKYEPHTKVFSMVDYEANDHKIIETKELIMFIAGIVLFIAAFFVEQYVFPMLIVAYLLIGWDILYTAFLNIKKGEVFDENFLMMIATFAAIYIGETHEAVGVFIFYKLGEIIESYAIENSRKSINSAKEQTIQFVLYENPFDGKTMIKAIEEIVIGDIIHVKPGERVMYDGDILSESASFDPSALTGESLPVYKEKGEGILSGYINLNQPLRMVVKKSSEDSTYAQIVELVNNAASNHSETEKMITKFARVYTPIVVGLATLIVVVPTLFFGGDFNTWIYRGAIFLVVSCPCALVISIPLVYYSALGVASRNGIIIKGSKYIDVIRKVENFVFDKTGTLTEGEFEIVAIEGDESTLKWAAMGEFYSTHPIAKAIVKSYDGFIDEKAISDIVELPSKGVSYQFDESLIMLGNHLMMSEKGISIDIFDSDETVVYVAKDNQLIGRILLQDSVKSKAESLMKTLSSKVVHILSGDRKSAVESVAKRLGITRFKAELLPEDKLAYVEGLENVAFIGDGINDGPVLARSDIGIAMGKGGSDLAIEQSHIIILDDDISKIGTVIELSNRVKKLVAQNIVLALGIKVGVMILGALGYSSMGMAIFADVGVALIAILNSLRLNY